MNDKIAVIANILKYETSLDYDDCEMIACEIIAKLEELEDG